MILIKPSNDEEIKKINRMKNVLYVDENNSIKTKKKIKSSMDYLTTSNRRNFSINFKLTYKNILLNIIETKKAIQMEGI